jgi:hypothetical protein
MRAYDRAAMKCPHCLVQFHDNPNATTLGVDADRGWILYVRTCPACQRFVMELHNGNPLYTAPGKFSALGGPTRHLVWPRASARPPCPTEVPPAIREDYNEACLVLADSPKASAALSRRCLQNVLVDAAKVKKRDLYDQIQEVLDSNTLQSDIADGLHMVRIIGLFAAHPVKSQHTGEIMPVEPGEAEWNLDVLESLFDYYYVRSAILKSKKDALNKKLSEAGKKPLS